eukprot:CAMPEP_0185579896 /NCGR_PEP_ID=MMETSP0434-20130131/15476_1 /TAXON_ID=626734 ORGANISM="Favella taraikaensis, Strain Fe Narragansett Bay" /NCGR_SAMPLE_ID=MMETSP0434 /ASSEMBLY_ACC=CAM_ASM_000379 /LENGTH=145 /DNA_ID=CAMNT_0028198007 /DNA_START=1760 /DNA_END=2194 /DNA_ORIENTATION=+
MSAWAGNEVALLEIEIFELAAHRVAEVLLLLLVNVVAARAGSKLALECLEFIPGTHRLAWAFHDSGGWVVSACAWDVQLGVLGLNLGSHAEGWILLLVAQVHVVTARADCLQITVLARRIFSSILANAEGGSSSVAHSVCVDGVI